MRDGAEGHARVIGMGRNAAWIVFEDTADVRVASLQKHAERLSLVTGDLVQARRLDDGTALVTAREPRTSTVRRMTAAGRDKTMAANVDTLAIVAAFERPPLTLAMIDELLAFAELEELAALLILTKADLAQPPQIQAVTALYGAIGYPVAIANPKAGEGMSAVVAALEGRRALLIGQSGVGKSSLFRALGGTGEVGAVSKIGRGKQTTTSARLARVPGGFLIDSPGVGEFTLAELSPQEVARGFVEFAPLIQACRFRDCRHLHEPGCAVLAAVGSGAIAPTRYASYAEMAARA